MLAYYSALFFPQELSVHVQRPKEPGTICFRDSVCDIFVRQSLENHSDDFEGPERANR